MADDEQFAWEYSKENVLPLRRGRDTKKMNSILTAKKSDRDAQLQDKQRFVLLALEVILLREARCV